MKPALLDTDILSLFLRGHPTVIEWTATYLKCHGRLGFSMITYYEIMSGLKHRDAHKQLDRFIELAGYSQVLPLTQQACDIAATWYGRLRQEGKPLDDIDLLIAGIALANNLVLVTRNHQHFTRIEGLSIEDWSLIDPLSVSRS